MGPGNDTLTQLRRGALPHCVLAVIGEQDRYGFELVKLLSERSGFEISEGTIYPLLSRLRRDGLVETTWRESESGPPRRYYRLTTDGARALAGFQIAWVEFRDAVDDLLAITERSGASDGT
ncbi:MAG: PadR family transcriptional regulator [Nitriliruptoraceae bacterium]|nr:PadR family transcriptional regulator [Nitriliruptoraceae bacterium]